MLQEGADVAALPMGVLAPMESASSDDGEVRTISLAPVPMVRDGSGNEFTSISSFRWSYTPLSQPLLGLPILAPRRMRSTRKSRSRRCDRSLRRLCTR